MACRALPTSHGIRTVVYRRNRFRQIVADQLLAAHPMQQQQLYTAQTYMHNGGKYILMPKYDSG